MKNRFLMFLLVFVVFYSFYVVSCTKLTDIIPRKSPNDNISPSVNVLSPTNFQVFNTNSITVSGSAYDNVGIKEVWLRLGSIGGFGKVNGTDSWNTNLVGLSEGTNEVYVYAVDNAGNISDTNTVRILYVRKVVFVSTSGNDNNVGIFSFLPVKTINKGIEISVYSNWNIVYVAQGVYTPNNGILSGDSGVIITNNDIKLIGGWDSSFNNVIGYSELDGEYSVKHIIFVTNVSNISLMNFVVRKGNANGLAPHNNGGGVYFSSVSYSLVSNIILSNNVCNNIGGGFYIQNSKTNVLYVSSYSNNAIKGGGIGIEGFQSVSNYVMGNFSMNYASTHGGGIFLSYPNTTLLNVDVSSNISSQGGGIKIEGGNGIYIYGSIYSNSTSSGGGGAIEISGGNNITISASIYNNKSGWKGGAIYAYSYNGLNILSSIITNNFANIINSSIQIAGSPFAGKPVLSNNIIGGSGVNSIGIAEENSLGNFLTGHKLIRNLFITNYLNYLYYETNSSGERYITNTVEDWTNINNPSITGATSDSTNNVVTNL